MHFEFPSAELLKEALSASANATTKIVFLVIIGVIATANGVFNDQGVSDLGRLVYFITLPSLLFVNILREVSVQRLRILWKLPAMALLHVSTGYALARLLTRALGIRGVGRKAVTLCLMFGNVGALSIAVINTLCLDEPLKSMVGDNCNTRGVEYISFYLIAQNILMFTWAEEIVKDHSDEDEEDEDDEGAYGVALPFLQEEAPEAAAASSAAAGGFVAGGGARSELVGDGDVEEQAADGGQQGGLDGSMTAAAGGGGGQRRGRAASQPQAIQRRGGGGVRFRPDEDGAGAGAAEDAAAPPALPIRRGRVGSLDRPPPGALPPQPPSLGSSLSGGAGGGRLKRFYSQPSILDPEDINSLLSRYPVESRPSLDIDSSMVSSTSSTYLPSLATSPRHASGLFRRRSSSRLLTLPQQQDGQQQQPPLAATGPARESDYLLGGQRPKEPKERRASLGGALPTAAAAAAAGGGGVATAGPGVTTTSTIVGVELERGQGEEGEEPPLTWAERACDGLLGCCDGTWQVLRRMGANPSIRAAMAAFALGLVPPLKALFVGGDGEGVNDPPLGAFTGAIEILGSAQVPCSMLMLSGSGTIRYLNDRAAKSEVQQPFAFSPKTVLCIIAGRVLLFPLLGLGWWWAGFELGLFQSVPILSLVVLLDAAVPTAQNIVMLILVHGKPEHGHALAYVLLWQYALCIPVLILSVTLFLAIIQSAYPA